MIDLRPLSSRQLQLFARIARWSLGLLLGFWLLVLAVWAALHGFIVPRIDHWRPQVERIASEALGVPVRIASVEGHTDGLFPTIHLQGISLLDAQGRTALQLPSAMVTLSARSVLRLGLEQLYIQAADLEVRQLADGSWQIAGIPISGSASSDHQALNWLLEQPELVLRQGHLQWIDEYHGADPVHLHDIEIVVRNHGWRHEVQVQAAPSHASAADGQRLQLTGAFRAPLLPSLEPVWQRWSGQWYLHAHLHQLPALPALAQLPAFSSLGIAQMQGRGQTRLWLDVHNGQASSVTADVALSQARIAWHDSAINALDVREVQGRLSAQLQGPDWQLEGQHFRFQHRDGSVWPSSNWSIQSQTLAQQLPRWHVRLDYADLALASQVADALPVPVGVRNALLQWQPQGQVRQLELQWQDHNRYQAKGQVQKLALQAQAHAQGVGIPGVQGLHAEFAFDQDGGQAQLQLQAGQLDFPGVFEERQLPMAQLQAQVRWHVEDGRVKVEVPQAKFANADAQGQLNGWWQMGQDPSQRLPGTLHLQGQLSQANGARVYRYLPLQLPASVRHYVRDSVLQGLGQGVEFEVSGPLQDLPFAQPDSGRFYIKAPLKGVTYAFVPPSLHHGTGPRWPALTNLSGTLVFEGARMAVQQAQSSFAGHPQLHLGNITASVADLHHPVVKVQAQAQLPMAATLALIKRSPLAAYTSHAFDHAQAQGQAEVAFALDLPLAHLERSQVKGSVGFHNTALQMEPQSPWMRQLHGAVHFSEKGFSLDGIQGQSLGGSFQLSGGMASAAQGVHIQAQGTASAQGIAQETQLAVLPEIARQAQGTTAYSFEIKSHHGLQHISLHSDLRGLAFTLPAPFDKAAPAAWPLTVQQSSAANDAQKTLQVSIPNLLQVLLIQDTATASAATPVRGRVVVGAPAQLIEIGSGISAQVHLPKLDADAWLQALEQYNQQLEQRPAPHGAATGHSSAKVAADSADQHWLQRIQMDVQQLHIKQRQLAQVKLDFQQSAERWHGDFSAQEFAGHATYRLPNPRHNVADSGRLFARLSHLRIPKAEVQRLNQAPAPTTNQEPKQLPALDIEVEHLEIADKPLGKLVLQARNTSTSFGRDWTLERFNLYTPEANWQAQGAWFTPVQGKPRITQLEFALDINSSGALLQRLGMPGVLRDGKGKLHGQIAWHGSPISPDWHSLDGHVHMDVAQGQFLKVEPGIGKLLSVLSLQSLSRRMSLDFRDVFSQGFAFDFVRGDVLIDQGIARTNNLQMKGLNAAVLMEGKASLVDESQDLRVVVVPEINAMTASLAATAINPVVGVGSFLAQMFLRGPLMEAATRSFHVHGTWADPVVEPVARKNMPALPTTTPEVSP